MGLYYLITNPTGARPEQIQNCLKPDKVCHPAPVTPIGVFYGLVIVETG
jgi:hypothetical protein